MNLARATLSLDSRADLRALVKDHVLSPIALVPTFSALAAYGPAGVHAPTGHAALDLRWNINTPNFNNLAYVAISRSYLSDDLRWIEHRPLQYVKNTTIGLRLWLLPTEQYYATDQLADYRLGGYTAVVRRPRQPPADGGPTAVVAVIVSHQGPGLSSLSITAVLETSSRCSSCRSSPGGAGVATPSRGGCAGSGCCAGRCS